ncbi:MAG TPA: 50S ribosomal protein L37 [Nitrososphaerales archaeon]|nr:50S ribosomal protein L37 [Nitrososphaerales archaeon]
MPKKMGAVRGLRAKFGSTVRKRYSRVYRTLKTARECPSCASLKLKRSASGIWTCSVCGYTVAGGAYDIVPAKTA